MAHYSCDECGAYLCGGECVERERKLLASLDAAGMHPKDYDILINLRATIQRSYQVVPYSVGLELKNQLDAINTRLKDLK